MFFLSSHFDETIDRIRPGRVPFVPQFFFSSLAERPGWMPFRRRTGFVFSGLTMLW